VVEIAARVEQYDVVVETRAIGNEQAPVWVDPKVVEGGRPRPWDIPQYASLVAHANAALDAGCLCTWTQDDVAYGQRCCYLSS
jgi:hypothetical protein